MTSFKHGAVLTELNTVFTKCTLVIRLVHSADYGKCSKISYTKVADKMPYMQTVQSDQGLHCLPFH